jgi:hypothetical protein
MGKDPAVLWYWNDWNGGTIIFTRHQKGCYMDLLHAQFNNGRLSLEAIRNVLGSDFNQWESLKCKFAQDESGLFYNVKAETLKAKRAAYSESRRKNFLSSPSISKNTHMGQHMGGHMENENEIENRIKDINKEGEKPNWEIVIQNEWKIPYTKIPAEMLRNIVDGVKKHGNAKVLDAIQKTGRIAKPNINYFLKVLEGGTIKRDPAMVRKSNRCLDCKKDIPESQGLICPVCLEKKRRADEVEYAKSHQTSEEIQEEITRSLAEVK